MVRAERHRQELAQRHGAVQAVGAAEHREQQQALGGDVVGAGWVGCGGGVPTEGAALPAFIPGVSWSDQWSFWRYGYPGIMVTDTAPFRYPHYHSSSDTPDKLDYDRFTLVVSGMEKVIEGLDKS